LYPIDGGRIHAGGKAAPAHGSRGRRGSQARAQKAPGQGAEKEASGKESVGFGMIAAVEEFTPKFESMTTAGQGQAVRHLGPAHDGQARDKNLRTKISVAGNVEADFSRNIGNNIEGVIVPLRLKCVLRRLTEQVEPTELKSVVIGVNGAAAREAS